ncbi:hypothetical protein [uncultured Ferrimonas sp.]|uniref:hypothetical protein n=1 Tax=uncultured Ferrimonas sp. TaxID=432640 RepID=UPI00262FBF78|nr:hypothetical protein [uncultured Ferrimonas sp.]
MGRETVATFITLLAAFCWSHPLMESADPSLFVNNGADFGPLGYGLLILPILTAATVSAGKDNLAILAGIAQLALVVYVAYQLPGTATFALHGLGLVASLGLMQAMEHAPIVVDKFGECMLAQQPEQAA